MRSLVRKQTNRTSPRRLRKRHIAAAVALLIAAGAGWAVWRAATAAPNPTTDFQALRLALVAEAQPPGEDQWPLFQRTLERAIAALGAAGNPDLTPLYAAGQLSPEYWEEARAGALASFREVRGAGLFEITAALPQIQRALGPREPPPFSGPQAYHSQGRHLVRAQTARLHLAWEAGDWDEVVAAVEESLALSRLTAAQGTLIDHLVAVAIHEMPLYMIRREVVRRPLERAEIAEALLAAIDRQTPMAPLSLAYEDERLLMLEMVQRVYTDDGAGDGRLIVSLAAQWLELPGALAGVGVTNLASFAFPGRADTVAAINALCDEIVAQADAARFERRPAFDPDEYVAALPRRQAVVRSMAPPIAIFGRDMSDATLAATRLLLRIELYRLRNGSALASLAELAAADPLADIVDPMTGERFRYRLLSGDPHGRPYLLYSVGADGEDNGGVIYPRGNNLALNDNGAGYDFVVNAPPEPDEWDKP